MFPLSSTAEEGVPAATTKAEVSQDKNPVTTEDENPAVAAMVGVPVIASEAEGPPDETPGAAKVGVQAAATKAGE